SFLNQPLNAEIEIISARAGEIDNLRVSLGSSEDFNRADMLRPSHLSELQFAVRKSEESDKTVILITTRSAVKEPLLYFVIDADWSQGQVLREFTIFLDPVSYADATTPTETASQPGKQATTILTTKSGASVEYELDIYYTNIGLFIPLTQKPMKEVVLEDESGRYLKMLRNAFNPRIFLIEGSVYPLPVLGAYIKNRYSSTYDKAEIDKDFNIIQALTEGFEEPYAISLFLGNVIRFKSPGEAEQKAINKGYSGLLFSIGDQHIKDAVLIDDDWYEVEFKIKGDRRIDEIYHSWSFRIGAKIHANPDISDVNYIGIRRELFNDKVGKYAWYQNTGVDYKLSFSRQTGNVVQHQFIVTKRWPHASGIFSLGIGVTSNTDRYTGALAEDDELKLILRPGYSF
ncbi:MAG: hypothetical protein O6932_08355, partial [Gammaproteobacteria bacterium]|nr:hypothetical protein [Gammaproteobacteria bacterium]